jgi:hypothetical protein
MLSTLVLTIVLSAGGCAPCNPHFGGHGHGFGFGFFRRHCGGHQVVYHQTMVFIQPRPACFPSCPPTPAPAPPTPQAPVPAPPSKATPQATTGQPAVVAVVADPYGFVVWLNQTRAQYGLTVVVHDDNLTAWAAHSCRVGGLHPFAIFRGQNQAWMANHPFQAWLASPGHARPMLDPGVTRVGIAYINGTWIANFN